MKFLSCRLAYGKTRLTRRDRQGTLRGNLPRYPRLFGLDHHSSLGSAGGVVSLGETVQEGRSEAED